MERLTYLRHTNGQPWHEHQIEFDELLLSAAGDSWTGDVKIGYLRNTFSNAVKTYTAAIPKTTDYYAYAEEVERIMTNLETTDQFKAANKRWSKDKKKEYGITMTVSAYTQGTPTVRVDADGDTVMALTQPSGSRLKPNGDRTSAGKKQRTK